MKIEQPSVPAPREQERDPLWSEKEAAEYLGVAAGTLKKWRWSGEPQLEFISVGRLKRYKKSALDLFLTQRVRTSTKQEFGTPAACPALQPSPRSTREPSASLAPQGSKRTDSVVS